ncbi:hypothetical protein [Streptomyces sp. NPDC059063]
MWKWVALAAGAAVAATLLLAALRAHNKRRADRRIDSAELNRWFRRHG